MPRVLWVLLFGDPNTVGFAEPLVICCGIYVSGGGLRSYLLSGTRAATAIADDLLWRLFYSPYKPNSLLEYV